MSRYDYPDPGRDPDYCDDLSVETAYCLWCSAEVPSYEPGPYCSGLCAAQADRDNEERD